ncbi:AI-2E family transporter [Plebeiibacterium sediminum]|uniref:AI-2E family transporter n=1 Tax=Plebeiibacterium sediminum TaxID=2992112 RepID=A0AAE3M0V2_9BACT|nr:AI-2E family transporter [Plebeiobacterium sediminum]MCW3784958.1 AI-2E family transporter [Plebeiobacterium sediminum]
MKENLKYIIGFLSIIVGIYLLWYFRAIVFFIVLSAILSLVARPIFTFFRGKTQKKIKLSKSLSALATVLLIWSIIILIMSFTVPFIIEEIQFLSKVDFYSIIDKFDHVTKSFLLPFEESLIGDSGILMIKNQINEFFGSVFNFSKLQDVLSSFIDFLGSTFIALFSVSFITFFLLKEEDLLLESIKLVVPEIYYVGVDHMLWSINRLLRRYFTGIIIQISLISILIIVGLMIIGLEFRHALIIGLFSGFINIIPYLGPIIGASFGLIVSMVVYLQTDTPPPLMIFFGAIIVLYIIVQLLDNILFQPMIFSTSVKAHPLEIFLVIIMAGYIAGMPGMFLAIPIFTIIRVIAKEFFSKYNLVRKLTGKLD